MMTQSDINNIRKQFPILQNTVYNKKLIFFDNAATTQKPLSVINYIDECYSKYNANVHRGVYYLSNEATSRMEKTRKNVANYINAISEKEIIFTHGTTESINLVASCFCDRYLKKDDEIIISTMEHHANIVPWQIMAKRYGAKLRVIPLDEFGCICLDEYKKMFCERTSIVAIPHVSNVLGTVNDVKKIISIAHDNGVPVLVDGAQAIAHCTVDVQDMDADFYVFSSHKMYGPNGVGVLYGKEKYLEELPPYMGGGEMISKVTFEETTYNEIPYKFEAGTPDYVGIASLSNAIEFINNIGIDKIFSYEEELLNYANIKLLNAFNDIKILGTAKEKSAIISFQIGNLHSFDIGTLLDRFGIAIRTGHHCAEPLLNSFGYNSIARASFAVYNTKEEIDEFVDALLKVTKMLS